MELFLNYDPEKTCVMSDYVKSMSDLTLMKLISRGHPDALKELLDRHMEAVALTAYRILCNHDESVSVVKDVFAGLWRKTFDYDYSLEIRNLLVMRAAEAARKRLVRNRLLSIFGFCRSDAEVKSWEGDTWEVFCRASHEMSPRQRVVYTLRELDSLSENISERMTGLSRSRISHLLDEAKKLGLAVLYLEVRESNQAARTLYESLGFVENGIRKNFYEQPVEHAVLMSKTL